MGAQLKNDSGGNVFLRIRPLQRVLVSLGMTSVAFFILWSYQLDTIVLCAVLWDVFSISYIITSWIVFFKILFTI